MTDRNKIETVKTSQIVKRIAYETRGVSGRHIKRRPPVVMDKYHNTVSLRTVVKPIEKAHAFFGCLGEVRAIYKNQLFVLFRKSQNLHLLRESHGYFAFKTHEIMNAGGELIDKELKDQQSGADEMGLLQGKSDRRIPDKKARGATVFITKGALKGYKGKIVKADEVQAQV